LKGDFVMTGVAALRIILHLAILLVFAPLMQGIITKTKAAFAGRLGAPLLQPYYDLARLFRKGFATPPPGCSWPGQSLVWPYHYWLRCLSPSAACQHR